MGEQVPLLRGSGQFPDPTPGITSDGEISAVATDLDRVDGHERAAERADSRSSPGIPPREHLRFGHGQEAAAVIDEPRGDGIPRRSVRDGWEHRAGPMFRGRRVEYEGLPIFAGDEQEVSVRAEAQAGDRAGLRHDVVRHFPARQSQSRMTSLAIARNDPSGLIASAATGPRCGMR